MTNGIASWPGQHALGGGAYVDLSRAKNAPAKSGPVAPIVKAMRGDAHKALTEAPYLKRLAKECAVQLRAALDNCGVELDHFIPSNNGGDNLSTHPIARQLHVDWTDDKDAPARIARLAEAIRPFQKVAVRELCLPSGDGIEAGMGRAQGVSLRLLRYYSDGAINEPFSDKMVTRADVLFEVRTVA